MLLNLGLFPQFTLLSLVAQKPSHTSFRTKLAFFWLLPSWNSVRLHFEACFKAFAQATKRN